jgi:catechol 2,3-dioxygenase-like lactoylglutathione lyase family enzyme
MTKLTGVNHLAMVTGDMDRTIRFWRDLLGLRLVAGLGEPGYRHYFFEISPTDLIAFFEWPGVDPAEERDHGYPNRGPVIFDHVSLGVETDDDLWDLKDRLTAAGFNVSGVVDHGFIHSIYSWDPNGIPIEFSAPVEGRDVRRTPRMADREPTATAREGAEPQPGHWPRDYPSTPAGRRPVYPGAGSRLFGSSGSGRLDPV